ncbi:ABC-type multidrug transport system ATPase subunit [Variovorax boronicumulans]|uniref:ABC transporter ATP-binding protein n=1 Tax=Variovorax boronicumulans TaxID=436515 RepID=UPI002787E85C|nr:ATP-binding cassette domain-containing protein [Variovorax boronicumulans]MDQ0016264.1 ABC-type multidrug transport system ATPase subunit [Variovorax boronicumulans]
MNTTPSHSPVLRLQDIGFAYPGQPAIAAGWNASIGPGITLLYGDTGAGKSALLQVIAGALPATQGRLTVAGTSLDASPEAYRRHVFFVDPATDRFDQITARDCTATLREGDTGFDEGLWEALVEGFSLPPHIDKPMYMLSTGSKRKVWLAAALASGRPLVLLDEPTAALDAGSVRCLWGALADLAGQPGRAVIVASAARIDEVPLAATIELPLH